MPPCAGYSYGHNMECGCALHLLTAIEATISYLTDGVLCGTFGGNSLVYYCVYRGELTCKRDVNFWPVDLGVG